MQWISGIVPLMGFHWDQFLANMLIKQLEISPNTQDKVAYPESLSKGPNWNNFYFSWLASSESTPLKILTNITDINKSSKSVAVIFFFCIHLASTPTLGLAKFEV